MNCEHKLKFSSSSRTLTKIPFLNELMGFQTIYMDLRYKFFKPNFLVLAIVGWGRQPNTYKSHRLANRLGIQFIAIEDGFLRSYATGDLSEPLSVVFDEQNIYYDSNVSSALEILLSSEFIKEQIYATARTTIKIILDHKLSKYNHGYELVIPQVGRNHNPSGYVNDKSPQNVLLVDQTFGDMIVALGEACEQSFENMLNASLNENPSSTIYVKTHPEVTSGRKKGYLTHIQDSDRIVMIRENVNPIDLIQQMDKVYVVTSQMGFEALICGKPVVCFGVPWYAGWGLTDDRVKDSPAWARRTKNRTVEELFAAAYIHYTRYLNPFTHKRGTIMEVINWLILQKKMVAKPFTRDFGKQKSC